MESVWVIGFNKDTGVREKFVCCSKNNCKFYESAYCDGGYDVRVFTGKEIDELIDKESKYGK